MRACLRPEQPTKISFAQQKSQAAMHEISKVRSCSRPLAFRTRSRALTRMLRLLKAIVALKTTELHASIEPDKHLRKAEFTGKSLIDVLSASCSLRTPPPPSGTLH